MWIWSLALSVLVDTNPYGTLILPYSSWDQSSLAAPHFDREADGRIDICDLVWFGLPVFEDVTGSAGVDHAHNGPGDYFATGIAWGDYDGDGWLDVYVTDSSDVNGLYRNNGNGTFSLSGLDAQVNLGSLAQSGGALFADFDNDGWKDLFVLNLGPDVLLRNLAGTGFQDVTLASGLGDPGGGQSGCWADLNGDSYLDLYITNWGEGISPDKLYFNNGDGTFTNKSHLLSPVVDRPGLANGFLDFDNDGDLDLYVVNDKMARNVLWRNDGAGCGDWCFTDVSVSSGADTAVWGMGLAIGDMDWDMDLDMYFSNQGPSVLLENRSSQGTPTFLSVGASAGVDADVTGWGSVFFDYDNDADLDLYLATMNPTSEQANRLFVNDGSGVFDDDSYRGGAVNMGFTLGVASADYDRDGHLDLMICNKFTGYVLYRNSGQAGQNRSWVSFELIGAGPVNRDAVGSRVIVTTATKVMMQESKCGSSFGSNNQPAVHFGLGDETVLDVTVIWPDGLTEVLGALAANQSHQISYPVPP